MFKFNGSVGKIGKPLYFYGWPALTFVCTK